MMTVISSPACYVMISIGCQFHQNDFSAWLCVHYCSTMWRVVRVNYNNNNLLGVSGRT